MPVLLLDMGCHCLICNEYYPNDQGRVHILNGKYALFDPINMTLEQDKVTQDVERIVYEGTTWPSDLADGNDVLTIMTYFKKEL